MKKIIIIGAGPAGLTAANELLKYKDYEVVILEETNEIGGISKTVTYKNNKMDMGGHRFFSKNQQISDYWKDIMPIQGEDSFDDKKLGIKKNLVKGGPNPETENNVMLIRNRVSRIYYLRKFFDYPISLKKETFLNMGFVRTIKSGFSYLKSVIFKRKENSLEDFYINRFGKVLYSMFFEKYTEKLWKRHPSQISADWGAQRVKGLSILTILKNILKKDKKNVETSLIEEFWYPKYGPGQLWEKLCDNVVSKGATLLKNHKVTEINIKDGKVISVRCESGEEIFGDIFISSMPLKDLVCGFVGDKTPQNIKEIAQGLPYIDFQTVGVLVNKLKIKNETNRKTLSNIVPDCWIYVQEPDVSMIRFQIFNNWSPYMVKEPESTVWIGLEYTCLENDEYWNMDDEKFIEFAIDELAKIGVIDKEDVLDTHREKVKKAYPAYFDTYKRIDEVIDYVNKIENIYCVGRNGQHRYNNMDHSMLTSIEVVNCIVNKIEDKERIWNVNTEKEYHEVKK